MAARNEAVEMPRRNEQRRNQLLTTALSAWDLNRSMKGRFRDARVRHMVLKTHERLRLLEEAELGVPRHQRSFFNLGAPDEPGVLLIHDVQSSPADLQFLGQELGRAGLTVHAMLLAGYGHGLTARPEARWRATLQQVRLGHRLLADTCREVHVVGVGFGAALAVHLAARQKVAGLVLLAPALIPRVGLGMRLLWKTRLLRWKLVRRRLGLHVDVAEGMQMAQDLLGKLPMPIYGAHCDDDDQASPQSLRLLQKRARHPQCRFQAYAEGGHDILAAHGREGLVGEVLRFIRS